MITLPDLLLAHGIELRQRGNEFQCLCFAHDDHNPSMSVYINGDGTHKAHCFSCGYHQGVVGAYCTLNGLDYENKEHLAIAIKALEGEAIIDTGKRHARIIDDPAPKLPDRVTMIPPQGHDLPRMDYIKTRDNEPFGAPDTIYTFRQPDGEPWYYEARWDNINGRKECRVFTYGARGEEPPRWSCQHYNAPRPIYGLDKITSMAKAQILICEGPRKAEAAQQLLTGLAATGWSGGAQSWKKADWSPISGRKCILWPDADEPGRTAMAELAQHLIGLGCECYILDTTAQPDKWDAADALAEGWDTARTLAWCKATKGKKIEPEESAIIPPDSRPISALIPPEPVALEDMSDFALPPIQIDDEVHTERADSIHDEPPLETYDNAFISEAGIVWSEPGDIFHEIAAPAFRPDTVPECLREWIEDTAGVKGVDPAILALSSIIAAATCLHDDIKLQPEHTNPGWRESARLWGAVVGSSGIKKSPAIGAAISRIKKIQHDLSAKAVELEWEYKAKEEVFATATKEYVKALGKDSGATKPARPEFPEIPRIYFEDVTVEKLADSLKASKRGCMILRDELAGFFGAMNQYKGGSGSDAAAWLEFYEGGPRYTDRINRGSTYTPNWGGCLLGGIQPSAMQRIVDSLPEDGMLQRFLIINARQGCEGNEQPYNKPANDRYHEMLQQIYDTTPAHEPVTLSPEANEARKRVTRHAFKLIGANLVSTGLCSHLSKYEGLFARIALTYHAIDCADKRIHPQSCQVSGKTAEMVERLMLKYLLPHAITFYMGLQSQSQTGHAMRKIGELCIISKTGDISNREMQRGWIGWRCFKPYDQEMIIQTLIDQGWILPHPKARLSTRGFPTRYLINPRLASIHAERKVEELERRRIAVEEINICRQECNTVGGD